MEWHIVSKKNKSSAIHFLEKIGCNITKASKRIDLEMFNKLLKYSIPGLTDKWWLQQLELNKQETHLILRMSWQIIWIHTHTKENIQTENKYVQICFLALVYKGNVNWNGKEIINYTAINIYVYIHINLQVYVLYIDIFRYICTFTYYTISMSILYTQRTQKSNKS